MFFFFECTGDHPVLHVLTQSFPTRRSSDLTPVPEIMVPLVATRRELELLKALIDRVATQVFNETGCPVEYLVGTMIELPRAALMAGEIAQEGAFFRSEARRVGKECVSTCRYRWSPYH